MRKLYILVYFKEGGGRRKDLCDVFAKQNLYLLREC